MIQYDLSPESPIRLTENEVKVLYNATYNWTASGMGSEGANSAKLARKLADTVGRQPAPRYRVAA